MRVSKASEERRQEILDAAMRVFYEKGYEKTSISDIALKLGVAQGLIYRYFKSKEALFDGALENYAGRLAEQMGEAIRDGRTTLREKIMSTQSFIHIEDDDSYYYKIFNSPDKKRRLSEAFTEGGGAAGASCDGCDHGGDEAGASHCGGGSGNGSFLLRLRAAGDIIP